MPLLSESDTREVTKLFGNLEKQVEITVFTRELECPSCSDTELILKELAELSDKLELNIYNQFSDPAKAEEYGADRVPAIFVSDGTHSRVRFFGTPSGYEFSTLLTTILDAGSKGSSLMPETKKFLSGLEGGLDINVFVTPTCPHCPPAAVTAARMAASSANVVASIVEANEFPELAGRYRVQGVPRTVVNENLFAEGAFPEQMLVKALGRALAEDHGSESVNLGDYLED